MQGPDVKILREKDNFGIWGAKNKQIWIRENKSFFFPFQWVVRLNYIWMTMKIETDIDTKQEKDWRQQQQPWCHSISDQPVYYPIYKQCTVSMCFSRIDFTIFLFWSVHFSTLIYWYIQLRVSVIDIYEWIYTYDNTMCCSKLLKDVLSCCSSIFR